MSEFFSLFFILFLSLAAEQTNDDRPPLCFPPVAPSAVHLLLPTLFRWCQEDVLFALA